MNTLISPFVHVSPVNVSVVTLSFIHSISHVKLSPTSASETVKLTSRLSNELFQSGSVEFIAWSESTGTDCVISIPTLEFWELPHEASSQGVVSAVMLAPISV